MSYTPYVWKNLPDKTTPINAENLNRIEEGIQESLEKGTCSFVGNFGGIDSGYYYEVYKHIIDDANNLINSASLTDPYYYYTLEGWAKCVSISEDGLNAHFELNFQPFEEVLDGNSFYRYNNGRWYAIPQGSFLGFMDAEQKIIVKDKELKNNFGYFDVVLESNGSGSLKEVVTFHIDANIFPTSSDELKFSQNDVGQLCVCFKIKLEQVRNFGKG